MPSRADSVTPAVPLWLGAFTVAAMLVNLYLIFLWAPTEATMGNVQRIFYFHVPSAALADVAFVLGGLSAIAYLKWRDPRFDEWSVAGNETGLIFTLVNIVMGTMWAKPVWGIWWTWDARLTSQFLMVLIYVGYLLIRQAIADPTQRAVAMRGNIVFRFGGYADRLLRQPPVPNPASGARHPGWKGLGVGSEDAVCPAVQHVRVCVVAVLPHAGTPETRTIAADGGGIANARFRTG